MKLVSLASSFLLFGSLLLPSCGSGEDGGGDADTGYKIAVIPKGTSHEFWKAVHSGASKAEQESDATIT